MSSKQSARSRSRRAQAAPAPTTPRIPPPSITRATRALSDRLPGRVPRRSSNSSRNSPIPHRHPISALSYLLTPCHNTRERIGDHVKLPPNKRTAPPQRSPAGPAPEIDQPRGSPASLSGSMTSRPGQRREVGDPMTRECAQRSAVRRAGGSERLHKRLRLRRARWRAQPRSEPRGPPARRSRNGPRRPPVCR